MPDDQVPSDSVPLSEEEIKALLAKPVTTITLNDLKQLGVIAIDPDKQAPHALRVSGADLETLAGLVADRLNAMTLTTNTFSAPASLAAPKAFAPKNVVTKKVAAKKVVAKKVAAKKAATKKVAAKKAAAKKVAAKTNKAPAKRPRR